MARVLVVEDDEAIRRGLCDALVYSGHTTIEACDGVEGLERALDPHIDLVLLDVLMPRRDGMEMLSMLRAKGSSVPVIFLTARGEESDRIKGLRLGADDYVVKPFSARELLARVEAVMRRAPERPNAVRSITIAGRVIDFERREIRMDGGETVSLTEREAGVLSYLASNAGRAVSRDELLRRVWGIDPEGLASRTVDMAVARLREHLRDDPASPRVIRTVRGKGYMLAEVVARAEGGAP